MDKEERRMEESVTFAELDEAKEFFSEKLKRLGAEVGQWIIGDSFIGYSNTIVYNGVEFHVFIASRKYRSIGIGMYDKLTYNRMVFNTSFGFAEYKTRLTELLGLLRDV